MVGEIHALPSTSKPDGLRVFRMIRSAGCFCKHVFTNDDQAALRFDPECPGRPDLPRSEQ